MKNVSIDKLKGVIGEEAFKRLLMEYPGSRIYIPKVYEDRENRNAAIVADYNSGISRYDLASIYGLSVSSIDKIKNKSIKHNI